MPELIAGTSTTGTTLTPELVSHVPLNIRAQTRRQCRAECRQVHTFGTWGSVQGVIEAPPVERLEADEEV